MSAFQLPVLLCFLELIERPLYCRQRHGQLGSTELMCLWRSTLYKQQMLFNRTNIHEVKDRCM